jgi:GNAT superfamily N-acetyltransferase
MRGISMEVKIRYATQDDAHVLGLVYSQSYQAAFRGIIPDKLLEDVFSPEKREAGLLKEIMEGSPINAILYCEDKPAGILTYGRAKDDDMEDSSIEILRIYLHPSYWGQNIGAELMNWGVKELRQRGYTRLILWVIEDNLRARKFYEKLGFVHDGETRTINVGKELKDLRYVMNI